MQSSYLARSSYPVPFAGVAGRQRPTDPGSGSSIEINTSGVKGNVGDAADQSVVAAAGAALDSVDALSRFAKAIGNNPDHKEIATFTFDRSGRVLSKASLDGDGQLEVYGSGSRGGANSEIDMFVPPTEGGNDDWSTQASAGLAFAAYTLNSVLNQASTRLRGANVDASA